jgi:hypothetical protein
MLVRLRIRALASSLSLKQKTEMQGSTSWSIQVSAQPHRCLVCRWRPYLWACWSWMAFLIDAVATPRCWSVPCVMYLAWGSRIWPQLCFWAAWSRAPFAHWRAPSPPTTRQGLLFRSTGPVKAIGCRKQRQSHPPGMIPFPAKKPAPSQPPNRTLIGCETAFSPVAHPANANILTHCAAWCASPAWWQRTSIPFVQGKFRSAE